MYHAGTIGIAMGGGESFKDKTLLVAALDPSGDRSSPPPPLTTYPKYNSSNLEEVQWGSLSFGNK